RQVQAAGMAEAKDFLAAHPLRYVVAPAALIAGTTLAYVIWQEQEPTRWINFLFTVWLLWHYQRQNWGVHSFVTRVVSHGSATTIEEWILRLAVVGGIIGGIRSAHFGAGTELEQWAAPAFAMGTLITAVIPVLLVIAVARVAALREAPLRLASLLMGACFFLPVFLFDDPKSAVATYALAHGLQYQVFMSYVARSTSAPTPPASRPVRPGLITLTACLVAVGYFLKQGGDYGLMQKWHLLPVFGLTLGATMAHFVIDAGIWRLRDEFPRRYIGAAFPFLPRRAG
ncbi:MAG TPA: hypothetical protein VGK20_05815, partial [Candidatus Binatia bacterium]